MIATELPHDVSAAWLPIDQAPEDEPVILCTTGEHVGEAVMLIDDNTGKQKWAWATGPVHENHTPLGWLPMPVAIGAPALGGLQESGGREVFVFGSNLAGRHGKGAALHARKHHGAVYGRGLGLQGHSYAIPTKDRDLTTLSLTVIWGYVRAFKVFAARHPHLTFRLTPIGCGLAGYKPEDIAPMFEDAPQNVILPTEFKAQTGSGKNLADATQKTPTPPSPEGASNG